MESLVPLLFFIVVAIDAYSDSKITVNHKRGMVLYTFGCVVVSLFFLNFTKIRIEWYWLVGFAVFTRLAFFDPVLNLLRGKPFTYEGDLNKPDVSLTDKVEAWTGISIFWLRIIYLVIYLMYLIFYLYVQG